MVLLGRHAWTGQLFSQRLSRPGYLPGGSAEQENGPSNGASLRPESDEPPGRGRSDCPKAPGLQTGGERRWLRSVLGALCHFDEDGVSVTWSLGDREPKAGVAASDGLEQVALNDFLDSFDGEPFAVTPELHDGLQGKGAVGFPFESRGLVRVATEACYAGGDVFRRPSAAPLVSGGRGAAAGTVGGGVLAHGALALVTCGADKVVLLELYQFAAIAPLLVGFAKLAIGIHLAWSQESSGTEVRGGGGTSFGRGGRGRALLVSVDLFDLGNRNIGIGLHLQAGVTNLVVHERVVMDCLLDGLDEATAGEALKVEVICELFSQIFGEVRDRAPSVLDPGRGAGEESGEDGCFHNLFHPGARFGVGCHGGVQGKWAELV